MTDEREIVDAEVVEESATSANPRSAPGVPGSEAPRSAPGTPGREAEDVPVDEIKPVADDGQDLRSPEEGEGQVPPPQGPPGGPAQADEGSAELASVTAQRDEYLALAQRTQADFENYRKRMSAEVAAAGERAKAEVTGSMIGVLDNLEHALVAAGVDPRAALEGEVDADGDLAKGVVLTYRELVTALARAGVQPDDPAGEVFDPTWHEALQARPVEGAESGTVVEVLQKGYRLGDQVIRAARVVVAE